MISGNLGPQGAKRATYNGRPTNGLVRFVRDLEHEQRFARGEAMRILEIARERGGYNYDLCNDTGELVGRFTGLDDAARVARYITGANMSADERQRAIDAMQDAQVMRTYEQMSRRKSATRGKHGRI